LKFLVLEIMVYIIVLSFLGAVWNKKMLQEAWTGEVKRPEVKEKSSNNTTPLPLGVQQVKEIFDGKGVIIDARNTESFEKEHIPSARSIPLDKYDDLLPILQKEAGFSTPLTIYCNGYGCPDSMLLAQKLIKAGYKEIFVFEGGLPEWQEAGYPTEEGAK
jgi:rhodanese-related sulfurtransferase